MSKILGQDQSFNSRGYTNVNHTQRIVTTGICEQARSRLPAVTTLSDPLVHLKNLK